MTSTSEFKNPVQDWLVELAAEVGLDISGFKHKVTQEFKTHTLTHHGNEKSEDSRGQIAITEADLLNIDEIIEKWNILASNSKNDISNFKIKYADAVVANSTIHSIQPTDGGSNLRPRSSIKSSIAD